MRTIRLNSGVQDEVVIPFASLLYPREDPSVFRGVQFGGKPLPCSVHYRTCRQIDEGVSVSELAYYEWTLEKLKRFGEGYERYLFSKGKGCGVRDFAYDDIAFLHRDERHRVLAEEVTRMFRELYRSIAREWDPILSRNDIRFFGLINRRYAIHEGRHRLCILQYTYEKEGVRGVLTDAKNITSGYYVLRLKRYLDRTIRHVNSLRGKQAERSF
jgi:hypothetical protein